jgi:hypothetical protein
MSKMPFPDVRDAVRTSYTEGVPFSDFKFQVRCLKSGIWNLEFEIFWNCLKILRGDDRKQSSPLNNVTCFNP